MNDFKEKIKLEADDKANSFKGSIKFAGKDFLVYDNFEFEGEKYYYIIENRENDFKRKEDLTKFFENDASSIRIEFIYEVDKEAHLYETVTDEDLLSRLNMEEARRILHGEV